MSSGQIVYYDLMTSDVEGAKAFYSETLGWKPELWKDGDPNMPYTMWMVGEQSIGGLMELADDMKKMQVPPHWIAYTLVENVDACLTKAEELGGARLSPPFDIPTVGRIAYAKDPQGGAFGIFTPASGDMEPRDPSVNGHFSWAELNTTDYEGAWKFYSALFGWKERDSMDMGEGMGTYFMFNDPQEKTRGGMSNMAKMMNVPPHWLHYVTVDDMNGTIERIKRHGGKVLNGPMPIPGNDIIAQCQDPQGAFFAVYAEGPRS